MTDIEKTIEAAKAEMLPFESWEKLPGEGAAAYAAFCSYRDYGPARNIRRAVEAQYATPETTENIKSWIGKRYRMWRDWSMRYKWVKRAEDYDLYLDKLKQAEARKTIEAQGEVHRAITGKMLEVVGKKLDMMEPGELSQTAVVDWVETAIRAERESAGLPVGKGTAAAVNGQQEIRFVGEFEGV